MESGHRNADHNTGRRVRELYRYFQPERTPLKQSFASSSNSSPFSGTGPVQDATLPAPPSPSIFSQPSLPATVGAAPTAVPEEALVLGNSNTTLTSFAQLAALRLDVERVLIRCVASDMLFNELLMLTIARSSVSDRNSQFILAQSTRSFTTPRKYESVGDGYWDGCCTISTEAWKMCAVCLAQEPTC
jgi:hypothetical protein